MSTLGMRIREARENKKLLQADLAKLIDVKSAGVISNWEKDLSKPDANKLVRLCKALDVSASYLLDYYGDASFEVQPHEIELIKKYRLLDDHGKELVTYLLHKELQRCTASSPSLQVEESTVPYIAEESPALLNAAHSRTDIKVSEDVDTSDDDIMDDEDF